LACYYFELQLASLVDHKKILFDAYIIDYMKRIREKQNIDVYLAPLMEELQDLWSGVDA
jgi:hypothetical protein